MQNVSNPMLKWLCNFVLCLLLLFFSLFCFP